MFISQQRQCAICKHDRNFQ